MEWWQVSGVAGVGGRCQGCLTPINQPINQGFAATTVESVILIV